MFTSNSFFSSKMGTPNNDLWPLPCFYAGEIKGLSEWGDYEISAGGDIEAPKGYYTYEGILMIYDLVCDIWLEPPQGPYLE